MVLREIPRRPRPQRKFFLVALLFVILIASRNIASYTIEYEWWKMVVQTGHVCGSDYTTWRVCPRDVPASDFVAVEVLRDYAPDGHTIWAPRGG